MTGFIYHLFYPQESNNHRSKLLHHSSILLTIITLLISTFLLSAVKSANPQVLGAYSDISFEDLLLLTNKERVDVNAEPLILDPKLMQAARAKSTDMFEKNYWSHDSPDGTEPWYFITEAGYDYVYAGENLARGFETATDVISAWMASPNHRANMLSRNFQDVGFSVQEGRLNGEDTVLIVEELGGREVIPIEGNPSILSGDESGLGQAEGIVSGNLGLSSRINSVSLSSNIVKSVLILFILTLILDMVIIERKKITRLTGHNLDHILFLTIILISVFVITRGEIL